jgi:putative transposase
MFYYKKTESERDVRDRSILQAIYDEHPTLGTKLTSKLVEKVHLVKINHKRVSRLRALYGLTPKKKRRKTKRGLGLREYINLPEVKEVNDLWAIDFMHSRRKDNFKYKILNGVDVLSKEAVVMNINDRILTKDVIKNLKAAISLKGRPKAIICDNGSEFCSIEFERWATRNHIDLYYIEPGKPVQNCYIESFNSIVRRELLNQRRFGTLKEARSKLRKWKNFYNRIRPHGSLSYQSPEDYAKKQLSE